MLQDNGSNNLPVSANGNHTAYSQRLNGGEDAVETSFLFTGLAGDVVGEHAVDKVKLRTRQPFLRYYLSLVAALKYNVGVVPNAFLNMEMKALGVL
jgi:hypothetical protein